MTVYLLCHTVHLQLVTSCLKQASNNMHAPHDTSIGHLLIFTGACANPDDHLHKLKPVLQSRTGSVLLVYL